MSKILYFPQPDPGADRNIQLIKQSKKLLRNPPPGCKYHDVDTAMKRLKKYPDAQRRLVRCLEWAREFHFRSTINRRRSTYGMRSSFSNALRTSDNEDGYITDQQMQMALYMAGFNLRSAWGSRVRTNISEVALCRLAKYVVHRRNPNGCGAGYIAEHVYTPCA